MLTFEEQVLYGDPLQWFGSGLEPDPEPTREFGPIANTSYVACWVFTKSVDALWALNGRRQTQYSQ